jgi:uncharacterized membrane protein
MEYVKRELKTQQVEFADQELLLLIRGLQTEGIIILHSSKFPESYFTYLADYSRNWPLYTALLVSLTETLLVIYGSSVPLAISLRLLLGVGLLGFIPGYFTAGVVFPEKRVTTLEWMILSIFLSVLISAGIGILLGLGPFFQAAYNVLALSLYTQLTAVAASYRTYAYEKRLAKQNPAMEPAKRGLP